MTQITQEQSAVRKFVKKNSLDLTLWVLFFFSLFLMFKSSSDPRPNFVENSPSLSVIFAPLATGNQVIFDITVGFVVSLFTYVLIVRLPAREKKIRLKRHLVRSYQKAKDECIVQLLFACNGSAALDLANELRDPVAFRNYFKQSIGVDQDRWNKTLNSMSGMHVRDIVNALDIFKGELEYLLIATEISDDEVFTSMRGLTEMLYRTRHWGHEYDDVKLLANFMWQSCAGWSPIQGYTGIDPIELHLSKI